MHNKQIGPEWEEVPPDPANVERGLVIPSFVTEYIPNTTSPTSLTSKLDLDLKRTSFKISSDMSWEGGQCPDITPLALTRGLVETGSSSTNSTAIQNQNRLGHTTLNCLNFCTKHAFFKSLWIYDLI